ncbi:MAG: hypothetical protein J7J68_02230 [Thermotogaceae bacterium]|nr:hypothetical protein [Thermotogaceae bacterium]
MPKVYCVGYASLDFLAQTDHIYGTGFTTLLKEFSEGKYGGCAVNIAVGLKKLFDIESVPVTVFGNDREYRNYHEYLSFLDRSYICVKEGMGPRSFIVADKSGNQQTFYYPGNFDPNPDRMPQMKVKDIVIITVSPRKTIEAVLSSLTQKDLVIWSAKMDFGSLSTDVVKQIVSKIRCAVLNEQEMESLKRVLKLSVEEDLLATFKQLEWIVVTMGGRGARLLKKGATTRHIPTEFVKNPKDPTGAGDGFVAGLVGSWLNGKDLEESIKVGHSVAQKVIQFCGAQTAYFM